MIRQADDLARMRFAGFVWDKLKERDRFEDINIDWEQNIATGP